MGGAAELASPELRTCSVSRVRARPSRTACSSNLASSVTPGYHARVLFFLLNDAPALAHPVDAHSGDVASVLAGVAAICSAVVWPLLIGLVLWWFREPARAILQGAVGIAASANRFRIWQIEFDRDVQQQIARSETAALVAPVLAAGEPTGTTAQHTIATQAASSIPNAEIAAATGVRALLEAAPNSTLRKSAEAAIKTRMLAFAQEYETIRASMRPGSDRTRAMNGVVAKMRTLAFAADLFLDEFMAASNSPGARLAAVCILQMKPEMRAVPWLVERMRVEQPFVFFHASVALLNAVRRFGAAERATLSAALAAALQQVQSFGEKADANTIRSLTLAQSELDTAA